MLPGVALLYAGSAAKGLSIQAALLPLVSAALVGAQVYSSAICSYGTKLIPNSGTSSAMQLPSLIGPRHIFFGAELMG